MTRRPAQSADLPIACPACQVSDTHVIETRYAPGFTRRRHVCHVCAARWTSREYREDIDRQRIGNIGDQLADAIRAAELLIANLRFAERLMVRLTPAGEGDADDPDER